MYCTYMYMYICSGLGSCGSRFIHAVLHRCTVTMDYMRKAMHIHEEQNVQFMYHSVYSYMYKGMYVWLKRTGYVVHYTCNFALGSSKTEKEKK